jgi:uncharacterized protein
VGGLGPKTAQNIVEQRSTCKMGQFRSRVELLTKKLLKPKLYEQAAGFLRVAGGKVCRVRCA